MQRQPTSVFLVADAYGRELRADAARTRRNGVAGEHRRSATRRGAVRRSLGPALIDVGRRLAGIRKVAPA